MFLKHCHFILLESKNTKKLRDMVIGPWCGTVMMPPPDECAVKIQKRVEQDAALQIKAEQNQSLLLTNYFGTLSSFPG